MASPRALDADVLALQEAVVDGEYDMARELLGDDDQVVHQTQGLIGGGAHVAPRSRRAGRSVPSTRWTCT